MTSYYTLNDFIIELVLENIHRLRSAILYVKIIVNATHKFFKIYWKKYKHYKDGKMQKLQGARNAHFIQWKSQSQSIIYEYYLSI